MPTNPHIEKLHQHTAKLVDIGYAMRGLANAFSRTGNHQIAAELWEYADTSLTAASEIGHAFGGYIGEQVRASQESSVILTKAVLMGAMGQFQSRP